MSRAIFLAALDETLGRPATPEEKFRHEMALSRMAGGEYVYIAHRQLERHELMPEIRRLRLAGYSVRRIAGATGVCKSRVAELLSAFSPYEVDIA